MSLAAKLTLERPKISDDGNVPDDPQKSNTSDSEASDDALDNTVEDAKSDEQSAEQTEQATEAVQTADQPSEFGQSAPVVAEADEIVTEIFSRTKIQITPDDPLVVMIQLIRQEFADAQSDMKSFVFAEMMENLSKHSEAVKNDIKSMHTDHAQIISKHTEAVADATGLALADFSKQVEETVKTLTARLDEVKQTTEVLENQKQFIVNDVYGKLNEKIINEVKGNLTNELKRIANNENNEVNKQKNMLIGAFAGLFVGMIFAVLIGMMI
ncbi:hypothetical protein B0181_10310 [Moraxella caviae]|uniref:Uncharacterized protein n=1 Tax=Moraxella caviae TaxID=34060 RepID=A0A1S9ZWU1_9GAMM|nr:hypothetical protein [Moraxella caviae]OOR87411.1 hypothetical protein B0181_10310 [Moraxella caviae]STZ13549.1 Uncharacterised protein [Moraxella caviae]VEW13189.1 Uncharacterised protein [Moraxella caviae]